MQPKMMKPKKLLCIIFLTLFIYDYVLCSNDRKADIPIGAVFDAKSSEVRQAFQHAVEQYNGRSTGHYNLKLTQLEEIESTDSFTLNHTICNLISKGVFAIFGEVTGPSFPMIESYSTTFGIPFLTTCVSANNSRASPFVISMCPDQVLALVQLIKHYEWRDVYYVYDSDQALNRLQKMFEILNEGIHQQYDVSIDVTRSVDVQGTYESLKQIYKDIGESNLEIILDVNVKDAEEIILKVMEDPDMPKSKFHFILGQLGILDLNMTHFKNGGINITGLQLVDYDSIEVKLFMDRWKYIESSDPGRPQDIIQNSAALIIDAVKLFRKGLDSLLKEESHSAARLFGKYGNPYTRGHGISCIDQSPQIWAMGKSVMKYMKQTNFVGLTGKMGYDENGQRDDFKFRVHSMTNYRRLATVGTWEDGELDICAPRFSAGNASDMQRIRIITTILSGPYVMHRKKPSGGIPIIGNAKFKGYCIDLAKRVAKKVGISYVTMLVKDSKFGSMDDNTSWDGMIGELVRQEADLAIADLTISAKRERVVDFTKPFMILGISIMIMKINNNDKHHVFSFMDPLSYEIWMCIVFAYIGVSVVLFLVSRFSPNEWRVEDDNNVTNDFTISNSLWFALGAFMQQGCDISPRSVSGRIVGCVWWFFTLIIISSYTANLAAFLTVERMLSPINSAEDLAKQTEILYGTVKGGSTEDFFSDSRVAIYQRMWAYMQSQPEVFVSGSKEGIEKVRNSSGKYAFLLESTTNEYTNNMLPCNTMKVGPKLDSKGYGIATPIGSDISNFLTLAVLQLKEQGELAKLQKYWWEEMTDCRVEAPETSNTQKLQNVAGVFYILISGLVLAVVVAFFEFLYKSKTDSYRSKISFGSALRSKARLSFRGHPDKETSTCTTKTPLRKSISTYTYSAPPQIHNRHSKAGHRQEENTHTQV